jgi:hypothetical protein
MHEFLEEFPFVVRLEVFTAMKTEVAIFWTVAPCCDVV